MVNLQAQRIDAVSLTVANLEQSIGFYSQALGFAVISDITVEVAENLNLGKIRIATLKLGEETIRLRQYLDKPGKPIPLHSQSNDLWFQHLAIVVSNMDQAYSHLQFFPIKAISTAPQTIPPENKEAADIQAFKFKDPDRHPLELICFPPDKGQQKWHQKTDQLFLGIDHTAIAITSTEQSLEFYCDLLGMQVSGGSLNEGQTQADLDALPEASVKITALRPVQGGLGIELLDYLHPGKGHSIPADLQPNDITNGQIELIVNEITNQFQHDEIRLISADLKSVENSEFLSKTRYPIKDPTGHSLLLIPEQN